MDKEKITEFFDRRASGWDADATISEETVSRIFKNAGIKEGVDILDVACGTGILFPPFLGQKVNSITAIDISGGMVDIARRKFMGANRNATTEGNSGAEAVESNTDSAPANINIIQGDAETCDFPSTYDCIIIYNAFPHFPNREGLIKNLVRHLKPGGSLTIAHGMSREQLKSHHKNVPEEVSSELPSDEEFRNLLAPYLEVTVFESDETMIQIVGVKK